MLSSTRFRKPFCISKSTDARPLYCSLGCCTGRRSSGKCGKGEAEMMACASIMWRSIKVILGACDLVDMQAA